MLRLVFLLTFITGVGPLVAQTFLEDFSNGIPLDFHLVNRDGLTPNDPTLATLVDSAWTTRNITAQGWPYGAAAFSVSWHLNDAGPSDDWMVTGPLGITATSLLTWDAMAITASGDYRDRYQVFVGTDSAISSLLALQPVYDTGDTGEVAFPVSRFIDLNALGYAPGTYYIAFRNFTEGYDSSQPIGPGNGGNELAIDNVQVTNLVGTAPSPATSPLQVRLLPNPADRTTTLLFSLPEATSVLAQVYDAQGRLVREENWGKLPAADHALDVSTYDLPQGHYLLRVWTPSAASVQRLLIQH